jgi:hypothetical protein
LNCCVDRLKRKRTMKSNWRRVSHSRIPKITSKRDQRSLPSTSNEPAAKSLLVFHRNQTYFWLPSIFFPPNLFFDQQMDIDRENISLICLGIFAYWTC